VPTWRGDVEEEADLIEEVARIVGYDRIPSTLPIGPLPAVIEDAWVERENRIRDILVGAGLSEVVTYSLTSRTAMAKLLPGIRAGQERLLMAPVIDANGSRASNGAQEVVTSAKADERREIEAVAERLPAITLRNPLSGELEALRLTLLSNLLQVVRENSKREDTGRWFFELGRRYLPTAELASGEGLPQERRTLGIALSGPVARNWPQEPRDADFFDLKGVVETLLVALHIGAYRLVPARHPSFHPGRSARLEVRVAESDGSAAAGAKDMAETAWVPAAVLGEVHPEVAARFDLEGRTYAMELDLERLFLAAPEHIKYQPIARYPVAQRDLAVVVASHVPEGDVGAAITEAGSSLLRGARLFDVYTGAGIAEGKKSLAYTLTYQSPERTLTDQEVEAAQQAIVATLRERFGAEVRGQA
jgi:phenylalanyl-tRNA synthetase beta chain